MPDQETIASPEKESENTKISFVGWGSDVINLRELEKKIGRPLESTALRLKEARESIASLNEEQKELFGRILRDLHPFIELNELLGFNEDDYAHHLVDKFIEKGTDGEYLVDDEQLIDFFEIHSQALAIKIAELDLDQKFDGVRKSYMQNIETAVENGWLPGSALLHLDEVENVPIFMDDGLDTIVKGNPGNYRRRRINIEFSQISSGDLEALLSHEFTHLISTNNLDKYELTGINRFKFDQVDQRAYKILNEALTEHFAASIIDGGLKELTPTAPGMYYEDRLLLAALCEFGEKPIPLEVFVKDYFNVNEQGEPLFLQHLKQAFPGRNIMREIAQLETKLEVNKYIVDLKNSRFASAKE